MERPPFTFLLDCGSAPPGIPGPSLGSQLSTASLELRRGGSDKMWDFLPTLLPL